MAAPSVEQVMATLCVAQYIPPSGVNCGTATVVGEPESPEEEAPPPHPATSATARTAQVIYPETIIDIALFIMFLGVSLMSPENFSVKPVRSQRCVQERAACINDMTFREICPATC
jgi:hypothetical protein